MTRGELERELTQAVAVIRALLWCDRAARTSATCIAPDDALSGRVADEYRRAILLASRYAR